MRGRLRIDGNAWHMRVYRHWQRRIALNPPEQIDLCHYMRAILLFTPGFWFGWALLHLLKWLTAPVWWPIRKLRDRRKERGPSSIETFTKHHSSMFGTALQAILLIVALVLIGSIFYDLWNAAWWWVIVAPLLFFLGLGLLILIAAGIHYVWGKAERLRTKKEKPPKEPEPERGPSLTWQWIKAKKMRVCPLIETDEPLTPEDRSYIYKGIE